MIDEQAKIAELLPGLTVEEIIALFFDTNALKEVPYKVWQLNSKGQRYYYVFDENGVPEFYASVTTVISRTIPKSAFLIKWIGDLGTEESERYKNERAMYGTFMHAQFADLLINRTYDLDGLKAKLKEYIIVNRLPDDFIYYADDLKKDVLSFAQFIIDYDVRPLAVEIALVHPVHKYAGMIDCPCTMLEKPGGTKRINAIVDFKSGRKGFYEESEIQLHFYKELWNYNFPDNQIDRVFNFGPKDWRKSPSYNLKDQTDSKSRAKIPAILMLAEIEEAKNDNVFTAISGFVSLDTPDLSKNVVSLTLSELVKSKDTTKKPNEKTTVGKSDISISKTPIGKKTAAKVSDSNAGKTKGKKQDNIPEIAEDSAEALKKTEKLNLLNLDAEI